MLFIAGRDPQQALDSVAKEVFALLDLVESEERLSSNYPPDEHYFAGYAENVVVTVYDADDDTKPEYRFRISLRPPSWRKGPKPIISDPTKIAGTLAKGGFRVFIPLGQWYKADWDGKGSEYAV